MLLINIILITGCLLFYALSTTSKYRKYFPPILMLAFAVVMGLRVDVGIDYDAYVDIYSNPNAPARAAVEPLWIYFCDTLRNIGFKSRMFFMLTSLFIVYCYYSGLKRMSPNIYLSFIIFIACGLYDETANTVRQCCAQSLLFASTPFLIRKEWIKYIVMAFIACMMHFSAVVGVVIMLFCLIRFPKWLLWGGLCLSFVLGTILMNMFANYLTIISFMIDKYHYTTTSHDAGVASGTLRYVYNIVGFSILLLYSRLVKDGKNVYLFVNLAIVGVCLYGKPRRG